MAQYRYRYQYRYQHRYCRIMINCLHPLFGRVRAFFFEWKSLLLHVTYRDFQSNGTPVGLYSCEINNTSFGVTNCFLNARARHGREIPLSSAIRINLNMLNLFSNFRFLFSAVWNQKISSVVWTTGGWLVDGCIRDPRTKTSYASWFYAN
jgi:hypothetical protein